MVQETYLSDEPGQRDKDPGNLPQRDERTWARTTSIGRHFRMLSGVITFLRKLGCLALFSHTGLMLSYPMERAAIHANEGVKRRIQMRSTNNMSTVTTKQARYGLAKRSAIVAALGGLLFGFDTAVISGTTAALTDMWNLSAGSLGFTVSSALIGTIIGALIGAKPADRWGRKPVLIVIAVLYLLSAILTAITSTWSLFLVFRVMGGLAVGASSVVAPMYNAEISPTKMRGRLVATVQFNVVLGIVLAYLSNWIIVSTMPSDNAWRWMLGIEAVPAAIFFLLLFTIPESPRWLFQKDRRSEARDIMEKLFDKNELDIVLRELDERKQENGESLRRPFFVRANSRPIFLAIMIAVFSQFAGTNAVLYYAPSLLSQAGIPGDASFMASVLVGLTNMVFTLLGVYLIDKVGRRPLLSVGVAIDMVALVSIAVVFHFSGGVFTPVTGIIVLGLIMVFIAALAMGIGSVLWVFISEIFPNEFRARGQALGSFSHWVSSALVSGLFPVMANFSMTFTFLFYAAFMLGALIWSRTIMPETKGIRLEEVG